MGETRAPGGVSVEFSPEQEPKAEDDTKEIVTPKAVQYQTARKFTTSRLVLVKEGGETSYPLTRDTYTLGRHRNNDIVVSDPKVSSFHARFDRTLEGFVLVDLRSRNGSFVNAKRVDAVVLQDGDEVRLGTARMRYKMD
jgi:pSer/pThr/pTyr-binding forkhead associated (FHA) protein